MLIRKRNPPAIHKQALSLPAEPRTDTQAKQILNSKHETLNKSQSQNTNLRNGFKIRSFGIGYCFGFRISDFEFFVL